MPPSLTIGRYANARPEAKPNAIGSLIGKPAWVSRLAITPLSQWALCRCWKLLMPHPFDRAFFGSQSGSPAAGQRPRRNEPECAATGAGKSQGENAGEYAIETAQ